MLVLAVIALEVPLIISMRDRVDAEVESQARSQAEIVAISVEDELTTREGLEDVTERAARQVRGRVIVVGPGGRLLADTAGEERIGLDYSTRPEIAAALDGDAFQERRHSETLNATLLATAVPVFEAGTTNPIGAVRITQSVDAVNRATRRATLGLVAIGLLVLVLGLAAGALIAGQVAGPVRRLDAAARRIAEGDLSARAKVEGSAEQQRLARTFNDMTERLERLLASQREFVADASHQLRTPLSGLRLRLEEARAATADPEAHEEIDAGLRELDRLSAMVSELLVLSQAGEVDAPPEQVDLEDAARRAEARWDGAGGGSVRSSGEPADALVPRADLDRDARRADRERPALRQRRGRGVRAAGRDRGARPRPRPLRRRPRRRLRALPPRRRRPRRAERHRPRAADRARAGAPLGRRGHARQPRRRRRAGHRHGPALSPALNRRRATVGTCLGPPCSGPCSPSQACCSSRASRSPRPRCRRRRSASPASR